MKDIKVGDRLIWSRQGAKLVCDVLAIKKETNNLYPRAQLLIDGWLGTYWETIDYTFAFAEAVM